MSHKIEITDRTYEKLKEYCSLNDLKIGQYVDKLIFDGLMIEMYGNVPFTDYRKKMAKEFPVEQFEKEYLQQPAPITADEAEHIKEEEVKTVITKLKEQENPEAEAKIMDAGDVMFGNQENNEQIGTISASDIEYYVSETKKMQEAALKQASVPTKVINKITKRRLK